MTRDEYLRLLEDVEDLIEKACKLVEKGESFNQTDNTDAIIAHCDEIIMCLRAIVREDLT